ncbi:MAG: hypothetical protein K9K66_05880 [Desulfarculaceae bacterium]|nr:hypothetical protein [Desulfarculaceae bacterium]MCF8071225.1 hypothetical protein [Desulfarculaceae bacterium]MCF8101172.1 hypothetical protein [Desulfarculaceae bacterium]MCF8115279.1 hypothetical protein [Desulfarculaceae bacterium]
MAAVKKGRKIKGVEFINSLRDMFGYKYRAKKDFAQACGRKTPNITNYLSGTSVPGEKVLKACTQAIAIRAVWESVEPLVEIGPIPLQQKDIPKKAGVYILFDAEGNAKYIGKAKNFYSEVWQTLNRQISVDVRLGDPLVNSKPKLKEICHRYSLYKISDKVMRDKLEALLLRIFINHTHNMNIGKL